MEGVSAEYCPIPFSFASHPLLFIIQEETTDPANDKCSSRHASLPLFDIFIQDFQSKITFKMLFHYLQHVCNLALPAVLIILTISMATQSNLAFMVLDNKTEKENLQQFDTKNK